MSAGASACANAYVPVRGHVIDVFVRWGGPLWSACSRERERERERERKKKKKEKLMAIVSS